MRTALIITRVLFGAPLVFFGSFGLIFVRPDPVGFFAENEGMSTAATDFLVQMWHSGFLMPSICVVHLVAGLLVLVSRYVPLALLLHAPVTAEMILFHVALDPASGGIAYLILALHIALLYAYRSSYAGLLTSKVDVFERA